MRKKKTAYDPAIFAPREFFVSGYEGELRVVEMKTVEDWHIGLPNIYVLRTLYMGSGSYLASSFDPTNLAALADAIIGKNREAAFARVETITSSTGGMSADRVQVRWLLGEDTTQAEV